MDGSEETSAEVDENNEVDVKLDGNEGDKNADDDESNKNAEGGG
jgi:hypothetical protein